jgi:soluble lytic murein transglycosylase
VTIIAIGLAYASIELYYNIGFPLDYYEIVEENANSRGLDPYLVMGLIKAESNFDSAANSHRDARGLMQLQPQTAAWCADKMGLEDYSDDRLFEAELNIKIGCYYLEYLYNKYDNIDLAIMAYNAGEGNVSAWLNNQEYSSDGENIDVVPFAETANYIENVEKYHNIYKKLYENEKNQEESQHVLSE